MEITWLSTESGNASKVWCGEGWYLAEPWDNENERPWWGSSPSVTDAVWYECPDDLADDLHIVGEPDERVGWSVAYLGSDDGFTGIDDARRAIDDAILAGAKLEDYDMEAVYDGAIYVMGANSDRPYHVVQGDEFWQIVEDNDISDGGSNEQ